MPKIISGRNRNGKKEKKQYLKKSGKDYSISGTWEGRKTQSPSTCFSRKDDSAFVFFISVESGLPGRGKGEKEKEGGQPRFSILLRCFFNRQRRPRNLDSDSAGIRFPLLLVLYCGSNKAACKFIRGRRQNILSLSRQDMGQEDSNFVWHTKRASLNEN